VSVEKRLVDITDYFLLGVWVAGALLEGWIGEGRWHGFWWVFTGLLAAFGLGIRYGETSLKKRS
jgi:hypothetical protein